jgi:ssDNA-binding replication factor A large subunit
MPNLAQRIVESLDKKACIDETESLHFWLWDPIRNDENPYLEEDKPTIYRGQLLFTPSKRQRDESLEII